jgi:hypothetical protein
MGLRPLLGRCHLALARLGRRAGDGGARQHLERATTLFGEMDMRFWMEQAEVEAGLRRDLKPESATRRLWDNRL